MIQTKRKIGMKWKESICLGKMSAVSTVYGNTFEYFLIVFGILWSGLYTSLYIMHSKMYHKWDPNPQNTIFHKKAVKIWDTVVVWDTVSLFWFLAMQYITHTHTRMHTHELTHFSHDYYFQMLHRDKRKRERDWGRMLQKLSEEGFDEDKWTVMLWW